MCRLHVVMELSLKSRTIKKKHKKKKIRSLESALVPLLNPENNNGEYNWMKLQEIITPVKRESLKKNPDKNMIKISKTDWKSKDYKPSFAQKASLNVKKSSHSSQDTEMQKEINSNDCNNMNNSVNLAVPENSKVTPNEDQNQPIEFNIHKSNHKLLPKKKSGHETRKNEAVNRNEETKLTKAVAMDCEMVGTGPSGDESIIARVSIVNSYGDCLYDEFVKPKEKVTDFRTKISGVRPSDLKNGKDLFDVQKDVLNIIEGRILVGHSIKHDLDVLFISHPRQMIRDTAFYQPFREICGGKTPSLKKLTSRILGCEIQSGEHSSVEDAQAAMLLYLRQRREWESFIKSQRRRKPKMIENKIKN